MKNRSLLMIPGPIEFEPQVLDALGAPTNSHVAPDFIETFGQALEMLRTVFLSNDGQPFILAGSGTLGMDTAAANLVEPGDKALVVNTGYFGDRFSDILERYGAEVTHVRAPIGHQPSLEDVERELERGGWKLASVTHVDTSTGVLTDVEGVCGLARQYGALSVVDGVCSVAGEELRMTDWGVDVAFTASQKAVGVPPGLALLVAGPRAIEAFHARKAPVGSYYADWKNWLPIMQAYENRKPSYFGTPAVNLVNALNVSLRHILDEGLETRFGRHRAISNGFKNAMKALELDQVPEEPSAAHTMTAPCYPEGVEAGSFLNSVKQAGVILAGGLHPNIKGEYFRIGHMGVVNMADMLATVGAIEVGLAEAGYTFSKGAALKAALDGYHEVKRR